MSLIQISKNLSAAINSLEFSEPVTHVYNPLEYAILPHEKYLKYGELGAKTLFMGMNPGPWGMAQTGVPFGEISFCRDFLKVEAAVSKPAIEHPKRPIQGFECARSEVSGSRLWGWVQERFVTPENFFQEFFVWNYCPLVFMEESGKNRTPDQLPAEERDPLLAPCDEALRQVVEEMGIQMVIGVGGWAMKQAERALAGQDHVQIAKILHPSPASPKANKGWAAVVEEELRELAVFTDRS